MCTSIFFLLNSAPLWLLGITRFVLLDVKKEPISKSKRHETDRAIIEIDQGNHQLNLTG